MSDNINKIFKGKITVILGIAVIFFIGYFFGNHARIPEEVNNEVMLHQDTEKIWTCSMHPQIKQPKEGQCPLCGMDLIPVLHQYEDTEISEPVLTLTETAKKLAEIQVEPVERKFIVKQVRMTGKIDYDETRIKHITTRFGGRLERLYVDYNGVPVKTGDHLVDIYSPELITAQEELIQSIKLKKSVSGSFQNTAVKNIESAKEKLRLWGLTDKQIKNIVKLGKTMERLTIYSPMGGIVTEKNAVEGMYVSTGTRIYTIADLSHVWLEIDAFESDIVWLHYGEKVEFEVEAFPGEIFRGRISFINPVMDEKTRSIKVRVNIENKDKRLKPGMFARVVIKAELNKDGKLINTELSGKWICPMHPEIIKDKSDQCDICGMTLYPAEDLGFTNINQEMTPPLVISASAPLITGKRAVVYIQDPLNENPTYVGREIILGPGTDDYYIVSSGLSEGELVVVNGNFKIDSALQISAKKSMMNDKPETAEVQHHQ